MAASLAVIALSFGVAGGLVGKIKGSSFWLWFLICTLLPGLGLLAALLYRWEREELRRQCPECGRLVRLHDSMCMRCGAELYFPELAVISEAEAARRAGAR